jgi:hypothetical protein
MIESFLSCSAIIKDLKKLQSILGNTLHMNLVFILILEYMDKTLFPKFSPMMDAFPGVIIQGFFLFEFLIFNTVLT